MLENKLVSLKDNFNKIMDIRNNIQEIFDVLHVKIVKLQKMHTDLIQACKTQLFVFGLDSFHFQNKIIDIEYEDMKRYFLAINNRMYCEYFKLYRIIVDYIQKNTKDVKMMEVVKLNKFPPYKDLEPFKDYGISVLVELHESILSILSSMISHVHQKEHELVMHESKMNIGLNIDNFVTTFNYNISLMREKIMLFIKYIEFFHILHTKYLQRFSNKIQLMYAHINNDIHLEGNLKENKEPEPSIRESLIRESIREPSIRDSIREPEPSVRDSIKEPESLNNDTRNNTSAIAPIPEMVNEIISLVSASTDLYDTSKLSVNAILHGSMSKSESTEEDMAVYHVFSEIETKCSAIKDVPLRQNSLDEIDTKSETIHEVEEATIIHEVAEAPIKKRRGRKKKSEV